MYMKNIVYVYVLKSDFNNASNLIVHDTLDAFAMNK